MDVQEPRKKNRGLWLIPTLIIVIISGVVATWYYLNSATVSQNKENTVVINETKILIEYATTSQEKEKGLCCRDSLPENSGMLFVYDQPGLYNFWMKDTRIPLDMYWISNDKKIIHIEHSVQPETYPNSFGPKSPAQYILETNAGFAKKHNIVVGDAVSF